LPAFIGSLGRQTVAVGDKTFIEKEKLRHVMGYLKGDLGRGILCFEGDPGLYSPEIYSDAGDERESERKDFVKKKG